MYMKKTINRIKNKLNRTIFRQLHFKKMRPEIFVIETVLGCNLRCRECSWGSGQIKRSAGLMSFEKYKIIADKIRPFASYVYLMVWGEPLLNKDIFKIIKYTSNFAKTNISTNGQLVNEKNAKELILSSLTDLIVSIDGATQKTYEKYRVGGNLDKALHALKLLNKINIENGNPVNIIPQFIVFDHNEHEIEMFDKICLSLGIKPFFKEPYLQKNSNLKHSHLPKYQRNYYQDLPSLKKAAKNCQDAFKVMTILLDGSSVPCCYDNNGTIKFGNIFHQDVMKIWSSPASYNFRHSVYSGDTPSFCVNNCLLYNYAPENNNRKN